MQLPSAKCCYNLYNLRVPSKQNTKVMFLALPNIQSIQLAQLTKLPM